MSIFLSIYFIIGALYFITLLPELFDPNDKDSFGNWIKKQEEYNTRTIGITLMIVIVAWFILWPLVLIYDLFCRIRGVFNKKKKKEEGKNAEYR